MGRGQVRISRIVMGVVAAIGMAMIAPGAASAANVDCSGTVVPAADSNGKNFGYSFKCGSPEGDATQIDAFSIVSTKGVSSFATENIVTDPGGSALNSESFSCEGPIPGEGFGCFGKASLGNTIEGGFALLHNPCSKKSLRKGNWRLWVVASAPKINPNTGAKTPATSEPLRLRLPECKDDPFPTPSGGKS